MYEKKIPFDIDCGIKIAMEVIGASGKAASSSNWTTGPNAPASYTGCLRMPMRA